MCKQHNPRKIDKCMRSLLSYIHADYNVLACCCGHGKYPMTIVITSGNRWAFEIMSQQNIPRKKRFYVKDKQGYYYIPETVEFCKAYKEGINCGEKTEPEKELEKEIEDSKKREKEFNKDKIVIRFTSKQWDKFWKKL